VSSSESKVTGLSRDLDKDKGERAGALAGGDVEERFREREEDIDKTEGGSAWPPSSWFSITDRPSTFDIFVGKV